MLTFACGRHSGSGSHAWTYFGVDIVRRERLQRAHPGYRSSADALTAIACDIKADFLSWIDAIGRRQRNPESWWASTIAGKSPLQSDLFRLVCEGELAHAWLSSGSCPVGEVVVEDPWLWLALKRQTRGVPGVRFVGSERGVMVDRLHRSARAVKFAIYLLAWGLGTVVVAAMYGLRPSRADQPADVLLYTWLEARTIGPQGFRDVYLGGLGDLLRAHGFRVRRVTPLVFRWRLARSVKAFGGDCASAAGWLRVSDVIRVALMAFGLDGPASGQAFHGRDYGLLLQRETLRERAFPWWGMTRLWGRAIERIAAAHAAARAVVYPLENQPWERLLVRAFRAHAPNVRLIGYQTAGMPSLLLNFFLAPGEAEHAPLPDRVATAGENGRRLLERSNYPPERLVVGGAFRFEHIWKMLDAPLSQRTGPAAHVLILLPIAFEPSALAVRELADAFREPLDAGGAPMRFTIACHPLMPFERIAGDVTLPEWFTVSTDGVSEWMRDADLCLFVAPTGAWREAMLTGTPVVKYRPDCLDLDPSDALGGADVRTCERHTVRDVVRQSPTGRTSPDRAAVRRMFAPVDPQVWVELVGSDRSAAGEVA